MTLPAWPSGVNFLEFTIPSVTWFIICFHHYFIQVHYILIRVCWPWCLQIFLSLRWNSCRWGHRFFYKINVSLVCVRTESFSWNNHLIPGLTFLNPRKSFNSRFFNSSWLLQDLKLETRLEILVSRNFFLTVGCLWGSFHIKLFGWKFNGLKALKYPKK